MSGPRIVIDSNVLVSSLRSRRGASYRLLRMLGSDRFEVCLSVALMLEYEDAAKRSSSAILLPTKAIDDILDYMCLKAVPCKVFYLWRPFLPDPKDDMVLELAIAGHCNAIVTFNRRHFVGAEKLGIRIVTPRKFLREIGELP